MTYRHDIARRVRIGLLLLAAPTVVTGLWAVLVPTSWYADYTHGLAPPSAFGHYNEHFVQDLGSGYLGIGAVLLAAAIWLERRAVQTAVTGYVVFSAPHFVIHLVEAGDLTTSGYIFTNAVLGVGIFVALWVWVLNDRRTTSEGPVDKASGDRPSPVP